MGDRKSTSVDVATCHDENSLLEYGFVSLPLGKMINTSCAPCMDSYKIISISF